MEADPSKPIPPVGPPAGGTNGVPSAPTGEVVGFYGAAQHLARSPLGIIALFIVLVYSVAGIAAAANGKDIPELIQHFMVWFPVLVLFVFTYLVVKHREKLYAPGDFTDQRHFIDLFGDKFKAVSDFQGVKPSTQAVAKSVFMDRSRGMSSPVGVPYDWQTFLPNTGATFSNSSLPGSSIGTSPTDAGAEIQSIFNQSDPHKGEFGGAAERNGWKLSVQGDEVKRNKKSRDLFEFTLMVKATQEPDRPMGPVKLYLHPTFNPSIIVVRPNEHNIVSMPILSLGSFTVGAELQDTTRLELDLSQVSKAPREFRER